MAWIYLDDDYIHHAKFTALSDRAFRLWHEGMAYCRKLMTDGLISAVAVKGFRYATRATIAELTTPLTHGSAPLWEAAADGYRVHDYLDWNKGRDEERAGRESAKQRMRAFRSRQKEQPVTANVTPSVTRSVTPSVTPFVQGMGKGSYLEKTTVSSEPSALDFRASRLVERYSELFYQRRKGAKYHARPALDFPKAQELVRTWDDDARLDKLAILVLTTDDEWISGTDRGFAVFAARASWADDRLAAWEAEQARKVRA